jgi:hypothetical protein
MNQKQKRKRTNMSINFIAAFGTFYVMVMAFFAYCKYDDWKKSHNATTD